MPLIVLSRTHLVNIHWNMSAIPFGIKIFHNGTCIKNSKKLYKRIDSIFKTQLSIDQILANAILAILGQ